MQAFIRDNDETFNKFKRTVALAKAPLIHETPDGTVECVWEYYDTGSLGGLNPATCPTLVCLPDVAGTALMFYHLLVKLPPLGIRVVALTPPAYRSWDNFISGLDRLLYTNLNVKSSYVLGVGLGGLYAQALKKIRHPRFKGIILCNSYCSTIHFASASSILATFAPTFLLKKHIYSELPSGRLPANVANSIDFASDQVELLSGDQLSSQLVFKFNASEQMPALFKSDEVLIIESTGCTPVSRPLSCLDEVVHTYPDSKVVRAENAGPFPYLSIPNEFVGCVHRFIFLQEEKKLDKELNKKPKSK